MAPMRSSALEPTAIGLSGDTALDFHWIWFFPGSKHVSRFRVTFCQDYLPLGVSKLQAGHKLVYECCIRYMHMFSICSNLAQTQS